MPGENDTIVARLVVERSFITPEQLGDVLAAQKAGAEAMGVDVPLSQLLVSKGLLTKDQARELLNATAIETGEARLVAGYEVISKLGQGGMGAVYKAKNTDTGELVALKLLPPSLATPGLVKRFEREADIVSSLDHKHIVGFVEFGFDPKRKVHYCALELIEGEDLHKRISALSVLPEDEATRITRQIADALQHAYQNGLVHRDVKPANIMVTADGTAKLLDLGLARSADPGDLQLTQEGAFVGSPYYASPEQATGASNIDIRSDIYSLGCTLYHMVTGKPPFSGTMLLQVLQKHLNEQMPWPQDVNPRLSDGICQIIAKMVAKSADDRYQEPIDILADLDILEEGGELKIDERALADSSVKVPEAIRQRGARPQRTSGRKPSERGSGRFAALRTSLDEKKNPIAMIAGIAGVAVIVLVMGAVMFGGETKPPRKPPKAKKSAGAAEREVETRLAVAGKVPETVPAADDVGVDPRRVPIVPDENEQEAVTRDPAVPSEVDVPRPPARDVPRPPTRDVPGPAIAHQTTTRPAIVPGDAVKFGGHFYKLYAQRTSWYDAKRFCEGRGGHLMVITSLEEQRFAIDMLRRSYKKAVWLGLTEEGHLGDWRWVTDEPRTYEGWLKGEPNNWHGKGEHWVTLKRSKEYQGQYGWSDNIAGASVYSEGLICEWMAGAREPGVTAEAAPAPTGPKLAPLLADFDAAMTSSDYVTAMRSAAMAAANPVNASHADVLRAASLVAGTLLKMPEAYVRGAKTLVGSDVRLRLKKGRVKAKVKGVTDEGIAVATTYTINGQKRERKSVLKWAGLHAEQLDELAKLGGIKPVPANRAIATAYKELASKNFAGAKSALKAAGAHPLMAHLKSRIAELDPEEREAVEDQKREALAASWTPARIKTTLWLDAADKSTITHVGGAVSMWRDKSGNGNHATQGNDRHHPSYRASDAMFGGMPSLYNPDVKHRFLETPSLTAQRLYMVCYLKDGLDATFDGYRVILGDADNLKRMGGVSQSSDWDSDTKSFFAGGGVYKNGSITSSARNAFPMPATLWKADTGGVALTRVWRILGGAKLWQVWDGGLGELILTDGTENLAVQQKMEGYLAHKWGLEGRLPAGHPYRGAGSAKPRARGVRNSTGYTRAVLADRPVVYYRFDEAYGSRTVRNFGSGGAAWDGMVTGRATLGARGASRALGTALDLSGRNEGYITTGRNISDILNNTASMEFWIKTTQITDGTWRAAAIAGQDYDKGPDIWWGMNYYGKIGIMVGKSETGAFAGPINDGQWHYVLMTFDRLASVISVYLDGNPTAVAAHHLRGDMELTKSYVMTYNRIGHGDPRQGKKLDAVIDEVAIYNRVLTGADGRAHYEAAGVVTPRRRPASPAAPPRKKTGASGEKRPGKA